MVHAWYFSGAALVLFGFLGGSVLAWEQASNAWASEMSSQLRLAPLEQDAWANRPATVNVKHTFSFDLLPKALNIRSSYLETREQPADTVQWRRHFSLVGTFFYFGNRMVGEGELAYTSLTPVETPCSCNELPQMMRLSLKDRWADFHYGANYRLLSHGFVSPLGETMNQDRDESQFWAERNLGPLKLRGSVGGSRERLAYAGPSRSVKTATTSITMGKPQWSAGLMSSFSLIEHDPTKQETTVLAHVLTGSLEPVNGVSLGSNLSFSEELDYSTGTRTETPQAGIHLAYAPWREQLKMVTSASYGLKYSFDRPINTSTMDASAGLEWKFAPPQAAEGTLSLNLRYNRHLDFTLPSKSRDDFSATIQLKVLGF